MKPIFFSPYTEYEFGVLAMNNVGRGETSVPVFATTGETSRKNRDYILLGNNNIGYGYFNLF